MPWTRVGVGGLWPRLNSCLWSFKGQGSQERGLLSFWGLAAPPQGSSGVPHSHFRLTPLCSSPCQPVHLAQVSFVIPAFKSNFTLDLELNQ